MSRAEPTRQTTESYQLDRGPATLAAYAAGVRLPEGKPLSIRALATLGGLSYRTMKRANTVVKRGHRGLQDAVLSGRITLEPAERICRLPLDVQAVIVSRVLLADVPVKDAIAEWEPDRRSLTSARKLEILRAQIKELGGTPKV